MKKIISFCLLGIIGIFSFYGYQKLKIFQKENFEYFLNNPKTNIFRNDFMVFPAIYDFYKLLHLKKEAPIVTQKNICLFQDEIFKQNKIWRAFNQKNLEKIFTEECKKQVFSFKNKTVYEFNGKICSLDQCMSVLFYYDKFIITKQKTVFLKTEKSTIEFDYNRFMGEILGLDNPQKALIIHLTDTTGIGNQLFQFWGNYIYALKKDFTPALSTSIKPIRVFHLPNIKIINPKHEIKMFKSVVIKQMKQRVLDEKEDHIILFNNPISIKNLKGYEDFILDNTKFKKGLSGKSKEISLQMQNENSISIHIRRGDFITDNYKVLNLSYYQNAIQYMKEKFKNPHFYVFSDDIVWAKENLKIDEKITFVDWSTSAEEDLQLMTKTKHNIIANSSFSWWGAFLNPNKEKIVIFPETGFYNEGWEHMKVDDNCIFIKE